MSKIHSSIGRRAALKLSLAASLGLPSIGHAAQNTLRYVPYSNLIVFDPVWAISIIGLEHAYMTCDQLYGLDESFNVQPQMAAGHELSDDRLRWRFTLRDGLVFHDGEKVRAIDCVASINRWSKRDPFGVRMAALLDEMKAIDDNSFEIRLKRPYAHMLYGLGATTCFIRPERLAKTDIGTQITDATGSGPFRYLADEFVTGSHAAYARHEGYVPRQEKASSWAGGKVANFDRVEWKFIPDPATAAAALQTGEVDWVERPLFDLIAKLKSSPGVSVELVDPFGFFAILWLNNAAPPFDNAEAAPRDPAGAEAGRLHAGGARRPARAVAHRHGDVHAGLAVRLGCRDGPDHRQARRGAGEAADRASPATRARRSSSWCRRFRSCARWRRSRARCSRNSA